MANCLKHGYDWPHDKTCPYCDAERFAKFGSVQARIIGCLNADNERLNARIKELEGKEIEPTLEQLQDPYVIQLIRAISGLMDDIEDLEEKVKDAFMAGFDAGELDAFDSGMIIDDDFKKEVTEQAYKEFCE